MERGTLTRQAMDLDVKGGVVIVQLRVASQAVSASKKHPQKNRRRMTRLLRIAQEAFAGYSSSLEPRSSDDGTTRQGCNHAGGWPSAMDYYNY